MHDYLRSNRRLGWVSMAAGAAVGVAAFTVVRAQLTERARRRIEAGTADPYLTESITINKPIEHVYEAWRNLESIGFLQDVSFTESRDQESHSWTSAQGAYGRVRFSRAPGARGTEVRVEIEQPQRHVGESVIRAFGMAADQKIREDLRRFKQLLETGEITLSDGPALWRPAQPPTSREQVMAFVGGQQ
jgi:uncharacterized membrane protein